MKIKVLYHEESVVFEAFFSSVEEMLTDLRILEKPSMFGNSNFKIVIERV